MKTAISIPDPIFEAADKLARRLGMSRSELYANAVAKFVDSHRYESVVRALDDIYGETESIIDPVLLQMQLNSLSKEDW